MAKLTRIDELKSGARASIAMLTTYDEDMLDGVTDGVKEACKVAQRAALRVIDLIDAEQELAAVEAEMEQRLAEDDTPEDCR